MSEVAGKNTVIKRINKIDPSITKDLKETKEIVELLKDMSMKGTNLREPRLRSNS